MIYNYMFFCIVIFSRAHFFKKIVSSEKLCCYALPEMSGIKFYWYNWGVPRNFNRNLWSSLEGESPSEFSVEIVCEYSERVTEEDSGTRYFGTSIKNTHSSSMAFYMLSHHGGTCKPWSNLESRDLESSNTRLASKPL